MDSSDSDENWDYYDTLLPDFPEGPEPAKNSKWYIFELEIQYIMHALGERAPGRYSARVIHDIVLDQMKLLISEVENILMEFGRCNINHPKIPITHEEILYLLKKNKIKLKRLLKYIQVMDLKPSYNRSWKNEDEDIVDPNQLVKKKCKRVNMCLEYLSTLNEGDDLVAFLQDDNIIDETARKRLERKTLMTLLMNQEEYIKYSSRIAEATFTPFQRKEEFENWLLTNTYPEFSITPLALIMLEFLARDTVAEIVDMVFYLRALHRKNKGVYEDSREFDANVMIQDASIVDSPDIAKLQMFVLGPIKPVEVIRAYYQFQIRREPFMRIGEHPNRKTLLCLANAADYRPQCVK